jgi:hypothetical protein
MGQMPELRKGESHSKSGDGWYIFKPPELAHFQSAIDNTRGTDWVGG